MIRPSVRLPPEILAEFPDSGVQKERREKNAQYLRVYRHQRMPDRVWICADPECQADFHPTRQQVQAERAAEDRGAVPAPCYCSKEHRKRHYGRLRSHQGCMAPCEPKCVYPHLPTSSLCAGHQKRKFRGKPINAPLLMNLSIPNRRAQQERKNAARPR